MERPGTVHLSGHATAPIGLDRAQDAQGAEPLPYREFASRREGMIFAMDGGLWLHRHVWYGRPMAHLVSTDKGRLLAYGRRVGLSPSRLQYKPLKDPRTGERRDAWHYDLVGPYLPPRGE